MKFYIRRLSFFVASALIVVSNANTAQAIETNTAPSERLPPSESSNDPRPTAPTPFSGDNAKVIKQAGVGGNTAYGRSGVLELGGGITYAGSQDATVVAITPTVGWFFVDNFELSGIVQFTHSRIGKDDAISSTYFTGLIEPSAHIPVVDTVFLFAGLGAGVAYDAGRQSTGFALAPRAGANIMVGRSGVLTPSATWNWSSNEAVQTPQGPMVALKNTYGININYTVMW